jgi:hypothetical protein
MIPPGLLQPFVSARENCHLVAAASKHAPQAAGDSQIVFDKQDFWNISHFLHRQQPTEDNSLLQPRLAILPLHQFRAHPARQKDSATTQ